MTLRASNRRIVSVGLTTVLVLFAMHSAAEEETKKGMVQVPLDAYQELYVRASKPPEKGPPPPLAFTLSRADVEVVVPGQAGQPARIEAAVTVHVLGEDWIAVPVLPAGTPVTNATLEEQTVSLALMRGDMVWSTRGKGTHRLKLTYTAPIEEAEAGRVMQIPLPQAASINLRVSIPGEGLVVSAVPASGVEITEEGGTTRLSASVPRSPGVLVAWRVPGVEKALITGAAYQGILKDTVVAWQASVDVKVLVGEPVSLPLLANTVALANVRVDGRPAVVEESEGRLAVQLQGVGRHQVQLTFETPIHREAGPTSTSLWLPRPPVSSFQLTLEGKKEVSVSPAAGVASRRAGNQTIATIHLPPTDRAVFSWSEALPEVAQEKVRANAEVYHVVRAEEGVLKVEALVAFQVTRGSTNTLRADLPATIVVNQVTGDGVSDWRVARKQNRQTLTVYLDRDLRGDYRFVVAYELLVGSKGMEDTPVTVPLLVIGEVHRQRGMVALLSGTELSMQPRETGKMTKVGENQLPVWVREGISQTVAHTYKYVDQDAELTAQLAPPERKRGKFDAVVDTLFSVGDGVMKALASVEIAIKSGKMMDLDLTLPGDTNLISVTAPSLRDHKVVGEEGQDRTLQLMFTQELEGTLRIEIAYERVLAGGQEKVSVPAIHVLGADMEQGRLAVEALTAVEVQPADALRVLPLDVQELPRQLTLRTTNPILLAYKYVHTDPPFALVLEVKHHAEMKVQVAAIDRAAYQTLVTRHGLSLSRAVYHIRNRRKQFLKVELPEGSELWSAMLSGQPVKPAQGEKKTEVLVPLLKSAAPFQVEIVYATNIPALGFAGWVDAHLPVPDIVETQSVWDVFLPDSLAYGRVETDMSIIEDGADTFLQASLADSGFQRAVDERADKGMTVEGTSGVLPLRIEVPQRGIHFRFEKLFANRGDERASFSIHFNTAGARTSGTFLLVLAVLVLAALAAGRAGLAPRAAGGRAVALAVAAVLVMIGSVVFLGAELVWAVIAGGAAALFVAARTFVRHRRAEPS